MCNCIDDIDAKLKERGQALSIMITVHGPDSGLGRVGVPILRRDKWVLENRRGMAKDMVASYCPWCGVRYETKQAGEASNG
jgi:hypothetical protein